MIGTWINFSAILFGGGLSLLFRSSLSDSLQLKLRKALGILTLLIGLKMMFDGFDWGSGAGMWLKQFGIFYLSAMLGILLGTLMRIEKGMAALTSQAQKLFSKQDQGGESSRRIADGFMSCTILFCVGPMTIVGPFQDGLDNNFSLLLVKSVLDGVSAMVFGRIYGWGVLLSAFPVLAIQGTISLLAIAFGREWMNEMMLDSVSLVGGFLVLSMSLVIFGARRIPIANYLPALILAPVFTRWWLS